MLPIQRSLSGAPVGRHPTFPRAGPTWRGTRASHTAVGLVEAPPQWEDEFTALGDRLDKSPLPLPEVSVIKRVVLVRHGQSTWNREGRLQGSSDLSELTESGALQAQTTRDMLGDDHFDLLFASPLRRARQTAEIIWGERPEEDLEVLPYLREVDLYSFQGLLKEQGKELFGEQFAAWQAAAHEFEMDGHAPVRELWYRASLAWQRILSTPDEQKCALVVAHNAVNQALICVALGLPPSYFRRLLQSNAAVSILDFSPMPDGPPRVTLNRLNQAPIRPRHPSDASGSPASARVVLVRCGATDNFAQGLLQGRQDPPLNLLGRVQAAKAAELLMDMPIDLTLCSPLQRSTSTASLMAELQALSGRPQPPVFTLPELTNLGVGAWEGTAARKLRGSCRNIPPDAEPLKEFWERVGQAWDTILEEAGGGEGGGGRSVVVVSHAPVHAALACKALGLQAEALAMFRFDCGSISVLDFPDGVVGGPPVIRSLNSTAHLGRWAVPVTQDDLDGLCGIDGCF